MENSQHVILFGSGHLALQVGRRLRNKSISVTRIGSEHSPVSGKSLHESPAEHFREALREAGIDTACAVYVLDDEDRYNIQFALLVISLRESVPVVVALFNEELARYLEASHPAVVVRSPARAATAIFVDALYAPLEGRVRYSLSQPELDARGALSELRQHPWLYGLGARFLRCWPAARPSFIFPSRSRGSTRFIFRSRS